MTRRVKRCTARGERHVERPSRRVFAGRWPSRGEGRAREQISPLSETTSWNSRYSRPKIGARIARAKRPWPTGRGGPRRTGLNKRRRSVGERGGGGEGGRASSQGEKDEVEEEEGTKRKKKVGRGISNFQLEFRGSREGVGAADEGGGRGNEESGPVDLCSIQG